MAKQRAWLGVSAIVAIAALLRLLMLNKESLWLDELASWFFAGQDLAKALRAEPANPPLYFVTLHFWIRLFGASETAMRSLSILPSVASVGLLYAFAKRLASEPVALLASAYLAVSSFQIEYAQEARVHAWLCFLILSASLLLWKALHAQDRRARLGYYAAYAILCTICLYAHFFTVFYLAAHGLYVLLFWRKQLLYLLSAAGAALLAFTPWLIEMLRAASAGGQSRRYLFLKFPQAYFSLLFGDSLIPLDEQAAQRAAQVLLAHWPILAAALFSAAVLAAHLWPRLQRREAPLLFALNLSVTPAILAFLVSFRIMVFDERYLLSSSPFLSFLAATAALGVVQREPGLSRSPWKRGAAWFALAAYGTLVLLSLYKYYFDPRFGKEQWREAVAYMDRRVTGRETAMVVFEPDYLHFCYDYYTKAPLEQLRVTPVLLAQLETNPRLLLDGLHGRQTVWLVRSHFYGERVRELLQFEFAEVERRFFPKAKGIDVRLFERRASVDAVQRP